MKNKYFWTLIVVVSATLIGLIVTQAIWIRNALDIKEKLFTQQVNEALTSIVNSLQQEETVYYLSHELYPALADSSNVNDLKFSNASGNYITFSKEISKYSKNKQEQIKANLSVVPTDLSKNDNNQNSEVLNNEVNSKDYEQTVLNKARIVERIVNRLINSHLKISERVKKKTLEETLEAEFLLKGINLSYEYAVIDETGEPVFKSSKFADSITIAKYTVRLYPDDIFNRPYFLSMYFPGEQKYILKSTSFMIISSIVLSAIIILIISLAIFIIFKQKKLSEIKTDFINNMTHELKTPISTISLASQMLGDTNIPKEQKNIEHLSKLILDESKRLGLQVEKVLQMAVFERAHIKLRLKRLNINELASSVTNNFTIQIKNRETHFQKCVFPVSFYC